MPIRVRERSGLRRTGSYVGGGAEDGGFGAGRPISVCERSALGRVLASRGGVLGVSATAIGVGATETGAGVAATEAGAGVAATGGATETGAAATGAASSSAPQSVSMSSVEGGGRLRGGSLVPATAAECGGMDDVRPRALERSASSLLTIVLGSHTPQMPSSDGSFR
jgi:hypothetical protein